MKKLLPVPPSVTAKSGFWILTLSGGVALVTQSPALGGCLLLIWLLKDYAKEAERTVLWGVPLLALALPWVQSSLLQAMLCQWLAVLLCISVHAFLRQYVRDRLLQGALFGMLTAWVWGISRTLFITEPSHLPLSLSLFLTCVLIENPPHRFWHSVVRVGMAGVFAALLLSGGRASLTALWACSCLLLFLLLLLEKAVSRFGHGLFWAPLFLAALGWFSAWIASPLFYEVLSEWQVNVNFFSLGIVGACVIWGEARRALRALGPHALGSILPLCLWLGVALLVSPGFSYLGRKDLLVLSLLGLGTFLATLLPSPTCSLSKSNSRSSSREFSLSKPI